MSKRDDNILLGDIIESIDHIYEYTKDISLDVFLKDQKTKDAVARNFEIMGEAVARMNNQFKATYVHINWKDLNEFRNIIIHDYEIADYSLVWDTIKTELPPLYEQVKDLLNSLIK